jgi:hypothetical protein
MSVDCRRAGVIAASVSQPARVKEGRTGFRLSQDAANRLRRRPNAPCYQPRNYCRPTVLLSRAVMLAVSPARESFRLAGEGVLKGAYLENTLFWKILVTRVQYFFRKK